MCSGCCPLLAHQFTGVQEWHLKFSSRAPVDDFRECGVSTTRTNTAKGMAHMAGIQWQNHCFALLVQTTNDSLLAVLSKRIQTTASSSGCPLDFQDIPWAGQISFFVTPGRSARRQLQLGSALLHVAGEASVWLVVRSSSHRAAASEVPWYQVWCRKRQSLWTWVFCFAGVIAILVGV